MKVEPIEPHGFCAGVTGAIRKALELAEDPSVGKPIYCLHELVHNELVVADLVERGFIFVESLAEIPEGKTVLFSAHGVSPAIRAEASRRSLTVVDATCPFVNRVHAAAKDFANRGLKVVVIGDPRHVEAMGIVGEVTEATVVRPGEELTDGDLPEGRLGVVSQTTMNADEVADTVERIRALREVEATAEVCHATKVRQDAVKAFDGDALLVLGSANSSNTRRLCDVARCRAFRAGSIEEVKGLDLTGVKRLGVTSGASTPESFFAAAMAALV